MESAITQRSKVSTATDNSKKIEEIVNPYLNIKFIEFLLTKGFSIDVITNVTQELLCSSEEHAIYIKGNSFRLVQFVNSETQLVKIIFERLLLPNSLDQFKMILACAEVIKLPRDYRTDEQKLQSIEYLVSSKMDVCYSLMAGTDNVDYFNICNAQYNQLKEIKQEFSNQSRF